MRYKAVVERWTIKGNGCATEVIHSESFGTFTAANKRSEELHIVYDDPDMFHDVIVETESSDD